jgi:hypothetical protein
MVAPTKSAYLTEKCFVTLKNAGPKADDVRYVEAKQIGECVPVLVCRVDHLAGDAVTGCDEQHPASQ